MRDLLHIKTRHLLLAVTGLLFVVFYLGVALSRVLYPFRGVLFSIVLFLMILYGVHRFYRGRKNIREKREGKEKREDTTISWRPSRAVGHIGVLALMLFVGFSGIQTQEFGYDYVLGIVGVMLLLPALQDVIQGRNRV